MAGKRQDHSAGQRDPARSAVGALTDRAADEAAREAWPRAGVEAAMPKRQDGGVSLGQVPMAEFARMSTSRQLSLWAILRAQISSQRHLAQCDCADPKALPLAPKE